jgi:hypothetical protein
MNTDRSLPNEVVHTEAGYFAKVQHGTAPFEYEWEEIPEDEYHALIEAGVKVVKLNSTNQ